jgi:hypothetical protein
MPVLRRYLTVLILAMWMGGFTFYALVVIPTATMVLGSVRQVGFITEQVTNWINLIGIVAILFFLWNIKVEWKRQSGRRRWGLVTFWLIMALAHVGLFVTHPFMDHLLNPKTRALRDYDHFVDLHTVYLTFATTEWSAALLYVWVLFFCWRDADQKVAG